MPPAELSVAIIGTGIAGETSAYLLTHYAPPGVRLETVYESRGKPGLHANSLELQSLNCVVDVPLRAVSPHYYPNLFSLYKHLAVTLQSVDYSSCGSRFNPNEPIFRYRNVILFGRAIPLIFLSDLLSLVKLVRIFRLLRDLLWMVFTGPYFLLHRKSLGISDLTLGQFLRRKNFSYEFVQEFLYPVMSTLLSCSYSQVDQYPCDYILEFYSSRATTIFTGWFRVKQGVQEVSGKLLAKLPENSLKLDCFVESVEFIPALNKVRVTTKNGETALYDRVIIATEPHVAAKIWRHAKAAELLTAVSTYNASITVHTDDALMPVSKADWRGLNYFSSGAGSDGKTGRHGASMTSARLGNYHPHLRQRLADAAVPEHFETWNPFTDPDPSSIVQSVWLTRAVWSAEGRAKFDSLFSAVQGDGGVYLVGSYAAPGVTLLEQAVTSACRCVQDHFGATLPFAVQPTYEHRVWSITLAYGLVYARKLVKLLAVLLVIIVLPHFI
jgi:predicted NAD/FAD-binding protein